MLSSVATLSSKEFIKLCLITWEVFGKAGRTGFRLHFQKQLWGWNTEQSPLLLLCLESCSMTLLSKMDDLHLPLNSLSDQSLPWLHLIGGNSVKLLAIIVADFSVLSL